MKLLFNILLLYCGLIAWGQNLPEYVPLDDTQLKDQLISNGYYGRYLEMLGQNAEALRYYKSAEGGKTPESERAALLEWYLGYSEAPVFGADDSLKKLMLAYMLSGEPASLSVIKNRFNGAFELKAAREHNLFVLPFLFQQKTESGLQEPADTSDVPLSVTETSETGANVTETKNGIPWTYDSPEYTEEGGETDIPEVLIQLGSFLERENAERHLSELADKGIEASIQEKTNNGVHYHITVVPAGEDVQHTLLRLKEKGMEGFPLYP
ncbi:MAG: SPOR domain-containing protein [Spirochaetales bacterium]|nr:SPOR domain-containing protein [Spirochaetales bacterium]